MIRVLFTLLFVGLIGFAQSASAKLSLGVVGVLNLSNLSIESEGITGTLGGTGFGGGIVAEYQLGENVAVSAQPMYLNKGAESNWTMYPTLRLFSVPILRRLSILDISRCPFW